LFISCDNQAGQTPLSIAQRLGYISVVELLKGVTDQSLPVMPSAVDEKYKVLTPETMQEASMSESEDEGKSLFFHCVSPINAPESNFIQLNPLSSIVFHFNIHLKSLESTVICFNLL